MIITFLEGQGCEDGLGTGASSDQCIAVCLAWSNHCIFEHVIYVFGVAHLPDCLMMLSMIVCTH